MKEFFWTILVEFNNGHKIDKIFIKFSKEHKKYMQLFEPTRVSNITKSYLCFELLISFDNNKEFESLPPEIFLNIRLLSAQIESKSTNYTPYQIFT